MSKVFLRKLLNELDRDLSKTSDEYRRETSDRKVTTLKMTVNGLMSHSYKQLGSLVPKNKTEKAQLDELVRSGCGYIAEETFKAAKASFPNNIKGNNYWAFSVVVDEGLATDFGHMSIFNTVKSFYTQPKNEYVAALNNFFNTRGKDVDLGSAGNQFFNLEHLENDSVAEQQVTDSIKKFGKRGGSFNSRGGDLTGEDLTELGMWLFLDKTGTLDKDTITVGLGSRQVNAAKAGGERALKQHYQDAIKDALIRLDYSESFDDRPGSDSRNVIRQKKLKKRVKTKLNKNIKTTIKTEPIKLSKGSVGKTKKRKTKVTRTEVSLGGLSVTKGKASKKEPSFSSFMSLQVLINAKLPDRVKKNMMSPSLQNRTGRFAESARVVDITQTKKGFPSIGFTYQKNPYQIFEQGSGKTPWASASRDPRKLIDKSIREIALELIEGRFYTRRV